MDEVAAPREVGVAEGGVELIDGRDVLQAEFMVFDVDSLQGMLFEGGIDAGTQGFKIRAEEMIRTGKYRYCGSLGQLSRSRANGKQGCSFPSSNLVAEAGPASDYRSSGRHILS